MAGKVVLVGAGPGDPGLITVRGLEEVRRADAVVYDRLVPAEVLQEARGAELYYVGKEPGGSGPSQEEINRLLFELASRGLRVVRLKGGDPLVFGRGEEECLYLASRGVECEVVPGVPSYVYAASRSMAALGSRLGSHSYTVATATLAGGSFNEGLARHLEHSDTLVVLMGARFAERVLSSAASARGWELPVVVVYRVGIEVERVIVGSLRDLLEAYRMGEYGNPSVFILVGAAGVAAMLQGTLHRP